jgi:hypothetical protein
VDIERLQRYLTAFDPVANSGHQRILLAVPHDMKIALTIDLHLSSGIYTPAVEWLRYGPGARQHLAAYKHAAFQRRMEAVTSMLFSPNFGSDSGTQA